MAIVKATDSDFTTHLQERQAVVVKYYADWCGACKMFAPKYRRISDEAENSEVLFLEVNAEESPEARKLAGVSNLPFLAAFKNGELLEGSPGSKEEFLRKLIAEAKG